MKAKGVTGSEQGSLSFGKPSYEKSFKVENTGLKNIHGIEVKLTEPGHKYFDADKKQYRSVSSVYHEYNTFDREGKSQQVADKRGISQQAVKDEWDAKRDASADFGTRFHNAMERYAYHQVILAEDEDLRDLIVRTESLFKGYKTQFMEKTLCSFNHGIAGTADRLCLRPGNMIDIYDYKTNQAKGIEFINKYGSYMHKPMSHLMDCNYNSYSLQLSIYAYMLQKEYSMNIGRICIVDVSGGKFPVLLPVVYLKHDVELILKDQGLW